MARTPPEGYDFDDSEVDRAQLRVRVDHLEDGHDRMERKIDNVLGMLSDFRGTAQEFKDTLLGKVSEAGRLIQSLEFRVASLERDRDEDSKTRKGVAGSALNHVMTVIGALAASYIAIKLGFGGGK